MQRILLWSAMAALVFVAGSAQADATLRTPIAKAQAGGSVQVKVPYVHIATPAGRSFADPSAEPLPPPKEAAMVVWRVKDFGESFVPAPGRYQVFFEHPYTGCPVLVCFELPCGCPKRVFVSCRELEWDYGKIEVEIDFFKSGRVKVQHRD